MHCLAGCPRLGIYLAKINGDRRKASVGKGIKQGAFPH
jgi:hypothetical protein